MDQMSLDANIATFDALTHAYSEPHRHYHTAAHIDHCLALLDEFRPLATRPAEVELAIWFHDAVYRPLSRDNEEQSAVWADTFLENNNVVPDVRQRVTALIRATVHDASPNDDDAALLVDIDLSILGADEQTYRQYEDAVRREYRWVPGPVFRRGRRRILQSFLERDRIYSVEPLAQRFESRARDNLGDAIRRL